MDFQQYYDSRKKLVNSFLEKRMEKRGISNVDDAMKYSLLAGGKRLRPILLMATAEAVGANGYAYQPQGLRGGHGSVGRGRTPHLSL